MSVSKNVDFPFPSNSEKKKYAAKVEESRTSDILPLELQNVVYLPVPGPEGPRGPKGEQGPAGETGPKGVTGAAGKPGKDGANGQDGKPGKDGKDGISYLPVYGQKAGWGLYVNNSEDQVRLGATRGEDGWVSLPISKLSKETNELYLPESGVSLYSTAMKRINLKNLKIGSQITITYNFEITTLLSNTEVWCRSLFPATESSTTSFVGSLKYEYPYELSVTHHLILTSESDRVGGIVPQVRTDHDSIGLLRSMYISVF